MSKFTDGPLVPGESVDVEDGTSLDDGLSTDLRANVPRPPSSTRVFPRESREVARDKFEYSVGISSVVKYLAPLDQNESGSRARLIFGAYKGVRVSRAVQLD